MNNFVGFIARESTLGLLFQCVTTGETVATPDDAPTYAIYDGAGDSLATGVFGADDHDGQTGLRRAAISVGSETYSAGGLYQITISYAVSTVEYRKTVSFNAQ